MRFIGYGSGKNGPFSAATGVINTYAIMTAAAGQPVVSTGLSVVVGDYVLLHQTQYGVRGAEMVKVRTVGDGQFTADRNLENTYVGGAQAVLVPQYTGGVNNNTLAPAPWNGSCGGILYCLSNGPISGSATLDLAGKGFRGGFSNLTTGGGQGESLSGQSNISTSKNGSGPGGGGSNVGDSSDAGDGGGGGGIAEPGGNGTGGTSGTPGGQGGDVISPPSDLSQATLNAAGAAGGANNDSSGWKAGAPGGSSSAIAFIVAPIMDLSSMTITGNGQNGGVGQTGGGGGTSGSSGGGSASLVFALGQVINYGTNRVNLTKGTGGSGIGGTGGNGSTGTFVIYALNVASVTGSNTVAPTVIQDGTLVSEFSGGALF